MTLTYWGIFFLSLPITSYLLSIYQTQARVAKERRHSLSRHMIAVVKEILRLTKKMQVEGIKLLWHSNVVVY